MTTTTAPSTALVTAPAAAATKHLAATHTEGSVKLTTISPTDRALTMATTSRGLSDLPHEILCMIGRLLRSDKDLGNFRLAGPALAGPFRDPNGAPWRERFCARYDHSPGGARREWKKEHDWRAKVSAVSIRKFFAGGESTRRAVVLLLRLLVTESFAHDPSGRLASGNLEELRSILVARPVLTQLASLPDSWQYKKLYHALYVVLFPLSDMRPNRRSTSLSAAPRASPVVILGINASQSEVYASSAVAPLLSASGRSVNLSWLAHAAHFYSRHISSPILSLHQPYQQLPANEQMQGWARGLQSFEVKGGEVGLVDKPEMVGEKWKGTYSYLNHRQDLLPLRDNHVYWDLVDNWPSADNQSSNNIDDYAIRTIDRQWQLRGRSGAGVGEPMDYRTAFLIVVNEIRMNNRLAPMTTWTDTYSLTAEERQRVMASIVEDHGEMNDRIRWIPEFDDYYRGGAPHITLPHHNPEAIYVFVVRAIDFQAVGWINPLPDQEGIPGWQRIDLISFKIDGQSGDRIDEYTYVWEGIIMPGGKTILGRWRYAFHDRGHNEESGPFMWWATTPVQAGSAAETAMDIDEDEQQDAGATQ